MSLSVNEGKEIILYTLVFCSQPTMVSVLRNKRIVFAAAGVSHSIFVDSDGITYTCGLGKGFLGHGDGRIKTVPTKVAALEVPYSG